MRNVRACRATGLAGPARRSTSLAWSLLSFSPTAATMSELKRQSSAPDDDLPAPKRQAKEDTANLAGGDEKQAGPAAPSPSQQGGVLVSSTDAAAASTISPTTSGGTGTCSSGSTSGSDATILELCPLRPEDRIEVKWDLHVDVPVDAGTDDATGTGTNVGSSNNNNSHKTPVKQAVQTKTITLWWGAFLLPPDGRTHLLTDDGGDFGSSPVPTPKKPADAATVPVRSLDYDAMPHYGFPDRSLEDVVFLSDHALLNMSSGTRAHYRKEGTNWEPSHAEQIGEDGLCRADLGQADAPAAAAASASAAIPASDASTTASASPSVTVNGEEGIRTVLDSVLLKAMSGVSDQLGRLNPAQQRVVAAKIADAKEKLVTKMVQARDGTNGSGGTVITPAYVKQCMEEVGKEL